MLGSWDADWSYGLEDYQVSMWWCLEFLTVPEFELQSWCMPSMYLTAEPPLSSLLCPLLCLWLLISWTPRSSLHLFWPFLATISFVPWLLLAWRTEEHGRRLRVFLSWSLPEGFGLDWLPRSRVTGLTQELTGFLDSSFASHSRSEGRDRLWRLNSQCDSIAESWGCFYRLSYTCRGSSYSMPLKSVPWQH